MNNRHADTQAPWEPLTDAEVNLVRKLLERTLARSDKGGYLSMYMAMDVEINEALACTRAHKETGAPLLGDKQQGLVH